ncbi:MAG: SDR family oxidoreductase [Desulfobacterales bacterium]|nr:SDR family oxidoreductase [Desulfobacterales bacterium]
MKLQNKIALVTGASKGVGKAIALRFCAEGAAVVLASRSMDALSEISEQINGNGGRSLAVSLDVTDPVSVQHAVDITVEAFGRLDIMVNNAGMSMTLPTMDLTPEQWRLAVETDLFGVFYGCQSAGRQMVKQGGGTIINISSIFGRNAAPMRAAYCASKAAVDMLTKVMAAEWAEHHIRVNAIAPGYVRTELVQELIDRKVFALEDIEKRTPQGRIGTVDDITEAVVFAAIDESSFMTGSILTMDGGWSAYGYL